jgi:hypothetical protein
MTARLAALLLILAPSLAGAQNLEPRLYIPLPTGLNTVVASYSHTSGDVIVDAAVPITDFRATSNAIILAYVRTFGLFGRSAQVQAVAPFISSTARAVLAGQDTSREMRGLGNPQLRFSFNLKGGPARRRSQLAGVRFGTIIGASLLTVPPIGQYDPDRYLNLSANRWAFKPELGIVQTLGGGWALEGYAGVWLFANNTEYVAGDLSQDPLWAFQGHVIHLFGRKAWAALDGTYVSGGTTSVNGVVQHTFQRNGRLGATGAWYFKRDHALKASFSRGVYTRYGGDFTVLSLGYQYTWGS